LIHLEKGYRRDGTKSKSFFRVWRNEDNAGGEKTPAGPASARSTPLFSEDLKLEREEKLLQILSGFERNREALLFADAPIVDVRES
jgi:hypothetical protein